MLRLSQPRTTASAGEVGNRGTEPLSVNAEDSWVVSYKKTKYTLGV